MLSKPHQWQLSRWRWGKAVGNELAERRVKQAAGNSDIDIDVHYSKADIKSMVKNIVRSKWQTLWDDGQTGRQYYKI